MGTIHWRNSKGDTGHRKGKGGKIDKSRTRHNLLTPRERTGGH